MQEIALKDGRVITDERISRKLSIIAQEKPEKKSYEDTGYEWDERGMAELFALCYCDEVHYCAEAKAWYTYGNGVWKKDDNALFTMGKLIEFSRVMDLYITIIDDQETRESYRKSIKLGDRRIRERVLKDAANNDLLLISATRFDENPYLINCLNGTYDLKTHTWHEHTPDDLLTMQTRFDYRPWDIVRNNRWEQFITDVMQGDKVKAHYLQKSLGYSILGNQTEEAMWILYGKTTRNGKSTLLNTICYMLGDYATVSPVSIICKSNSAKNSESANPMVASLKGKRFVTMAESQQYGKLDEESIKQFTGGEEIKARNLYEKPITFLPQFTMWLSCNDLPMVQDKSIFLSDRIRVITFDRHFSHSEQDKGLKNYFCQKESMRGIFEWLIEGYKMFTEEGLEMPGEIQEVVDQYCKDNDLVLQFLEENCTLDDTKQMSSTELYKAYSLWCKNNGSYTCTSRKFGADLTAHTEWYKRRKRIHGVTYYEGLAYKGSD